MYKPIKIFKVGKHTSMQGLTLDYTKDMLADCVAGYSATVHEAPLVLGHPKHNDPAGGWVDHMELDADGFLWAYPKKLDPEFAEVVNAGKNNKVSASFYLPDSPNNPTPGKLYLRHVGFLGALPPSVKGLGSVSFAEGETGIAEFGDWGHEYSADLFRNVRDWLIDTQGQEVADKVLPNWLITSLREYANAKPQEIQAAFAELMPPGSPAPTPAPAPAPTKTANEIALEQQLAQANAKIAASNKAAQEADAVAFAENLVNVTGQLPPLAKDKAIKLLVAASDGEQVVSFAEGDQKPFAEGLKDLLSSLPPIVNFGEQQGQKGKVDPSINNPENPLVAEAKSRAAAATR